MVLTSTGMIEVTKTTMAPSQLPKRNVSHHSTANSRLNEGLCTSQRIAG